MPISSITAHFEGAIPSTCFQNVQNLYVVVVFIKTWRLKPCLRAIAPHANAMTISTLSRLLFQEHPSVWETGVGQGPRGRAMDWTGQSARSRRSSATCQARSVGCCQWLRDSKPPSTMIQGSLWISVSHTFGSPVRTTVLKLETA